MLSVAWYGVLGKGKERVLGPGFKSVMHTPSIGWRSPTIFRYLCTLIHITICNERRNQEHDQPSYGVLVRQDLQAKFYGPSGVWQG